MKNLPLLLGTIIGSIVLIVAIGWLFSRTTTPTVGAADRAVVEANLTKVQGPTDAKVVVVEFSDFQCPACRSVAPLVESLAKQYGNQVKFAYRHLPLEQIHSNARAAAIAAEAANKQSAFWPYHDLLFSKQSEWDEIDDQKDLIEKFVSYATELKLNGEQFRSDLADQTLAGVVDIDLAASRQLKVQATPTFFVNGQPASSTELESLINQALAASGVVASTLPNPVAASTSATAGTPSPQP